MNLVACATTIYVIVQVRSLVLGNIDLARQLLKGAVGSQSPAIVRAVVNFVRGTSPVQQVGVYCVEATIEASTQACIHAGRTSY